MIMKILKRKMIYIMTTPQYVLWDKYWRSYRIDSESAIQIALQQIPGEVIKVELDTENGVLVYEVTIRNNTGIYEISIDANTGQIVEFD
ncbi:PepSY domain-containing protein [Clostridium tetani]|uniref:PepSY domain-containing protein n=2 Tax=Clostridium tetani TaxID=1513 RepID=UPI001FB07843|nr:PepSY domain-containing protein [Clostridium tetani]